MPSTRRRSNTKLLALLIILLLGAFLVAFFAWARQYLKPSVPAEVVKAENALFSSNSLLVAHINVGKIAELDQLAGTNSLETSQYDNDFLQALTHHELLLNQQLRHLVVGSDSQGTPIIGAFGEFSRANLEAFIQHYYQASNSDSSGVSYWTITKQNRYSCEFSPERGVVLTDGAVFWGSPQGVIEYYKAYQQASTVSHDVAWANYRGSRLVSVALLSPANVDGLNPGGFAGMFFSKATKNVVNAQALYLGVKAEILPPQARLDLQMHSDDKEWLELIRAGAAKGLKDLNAHLSNDPDSKLAKLVSGGIHVETEGSVLNAQMVLNEDFFTEVNTLIKGGMGAMMSLGSASAQTNGEIIPDQINEQANPYPLELPVTELSAYSDKYNRRHDFIDGAFAGQFTNFEISDTGKKELTIELRSSEILKDFPHYRPSIGEFSITAIYDKQGQNILALETCGRELNSEAVELSVMNSELNSTKTVRLIETKNISDIVEIEYQLTAAIPTQFERKVIDVSPTEQMVHAHGAEVTISGSSGELNYRVSGDDKRLASIRPMTAKEQFLETSGSWGFSGNTSVSVVGTPVKAELVFTKAYKTIELNKRSKVQPYQQESRSYIPESLPATPLTTEQLEAVTNTQADVAIFDLYQVHPWHNKPQVATSASPIAVGVYEANISTFGQDVSLEAQMAVLIPKIENAENHNMCAFTVNEIELAGKGKVTINHTSPCSAEAINVWGSDLPEPPYMASRLNIKAALPAHYNELSEEPAITSISGSVTLTLAQSIKEQAVSLPNVGEEFTLGGLSLMLVQQTPSALKFYVKGDTSLLHSVKLLDKNHQLQSDDFDLQPRGLFDKHKVWNEESVNVLEFRATFGKADSIVFNTIEQAEVITRQFKLQLPQNQ